VFPEANGSRRRFVWNPCQRRNAIAGGVIPQYCVGAIDDHDDLIHGNYHACQTRSNRPIHILPGLVVGVIFCTFQRSFSFTGTIPVQLYERRRRRKVLRKGVVTPARTIYRKTINFSDISCKWLLFWCPSWWLALLFHSSCSNNRNDLFCFFSFTLEIVELLCPFVFFLFNPLPTFPRAAMAEEEYEDEEYEEISDEEKLKIATHFLLSSPAGEIKELVNDVKNIIPSSVLNEDSIKSIFRTHNIDQQTLGETTNGDVMLVSKHGEIDDNHYVDPRAGKIYGYNHVTQVGGRFFC
jgi:hypothetical protein